MSYDEFFSHDDKPFAENLNDALLLSNVFDLTVPIQLPRMFSNSTWVNSTSERKASVSLVKLNNSLPSGLSVSTLDGESVITGTGTMQLLVYPNFNSFGKYKSVTWDSVNNKIQVNLKTKTGTTILSNISKGTLVSVPSALQQLDQIIIELVFTANDTLKSLEFVMENKQQERYGAEVGISDVNGLQDDLNSKVNVSDIRNNLTSTDVDKPLSANMGKQLKTLVDGKSDNTHNHDDRYYTESEVSGWYQVTTTSCSYATIYVNPSLRLVDFRYYRQDFNFFNSNTEILMCTIPQQPSVNGTPTNIRPVMPTPLTTFNASMVGAVYTDGTVVASSNSTGVKNVNLRGMWHY